jgi:hypothetical protein
LQKDVPDFSPGYRPVGDVNQQVVSVVYIPAPYRETKVVADKQQYVPAPVRDYGTAIARREMFRFVAHAEQVPLVVKIGFSFGSEEKGAVVIGGMFAG